MGEEGEYIVYVGSLTVPLHNLWADAAIAYQKAHYPKMKLVADRYGVAESVDDSYKTAIDAMLAHPNLKGILTFGSQGPIGAGRAIKEKGKAGKIALVGSFLAFARRETLERRSDSDGLHVEPDGGR